LSPNLEAALGGGGPGGGSGLPPNLEAALGGGGPGGGGGLSPNLEAALGGGGPGGGGGLSPNLEAALGGGPVGGGGGAFCFVRVGLAAAFLWWPSLVLGGVAFFLAGCFLFLALSSLTLLERLKPTVFLLVEGLVIFFLLLVLSILALSC
jgi:hypothetical protein